MTALSGFIFDVKLENLLRFSDDIKGIKELVQATILEFEVLVGL